MKTPRTPKLNGSRQPAPLAGPIQPPPTAPVFDAEGIALQRRLRFNPLRALDPQNLSLALDQFDLGILRQAALLWDAMIRRDDTLSFVVPQLENAIAGKPWGVFKKKGADETEAARHAAALEYFYANVTAVDAFDRNVRGDRHLLLKQMGSSYALRYAAHHFVWKPTPGKMVEVEGAAPVPALSAELEHVPLWFFENTTGTLRFLPFGGYGINGQELDWEGEWMVTSGQGLMFAASISYVFKRLGFQDWTIFNERYAQQKVLGQTNAQKDSEPGRAMADIVANFNGDQGIVLYESQAADKPPISLLGPEGTASVDLFERFLDRQDRKMAVMFRGSDLRNMSREKDTTGVSAQNDETEALELAHCASIASACRTYIDRNVIRYCFGEGVEPLAYFGLPDMDSEDAQQLRESAGFLADRGAKVELATVAERLGVTLCEDEEDALQAATPAPGSEAKPAKDAVITANAARLNRLQQLVEEALRTANAANAADEDGHWVTINHEHVFIKNGDKRPIGEIVGHPVAHGDSHELFDPKKHLGGDDIRVGVKALDATFAQRADHPFVPTINGHVLKTTPAGKRQQTHRTVEEAKAHAISHLKSIGALEKGARPSAAAVAADDHHPRDAAGNKADLSRGDGWTQAYDKKTQSYKPGWSEHGMKLKGFTTPAVERAAVIYREGEKIQSGPNAPSGYDAQIEHMQKYNQPLADAWMAAEAFAGGKDDAAAFAEHRKKLAKEHA